MHATAFNQQGNLAMTPRDYQSTISANVSPKDAYDKIARVSEWWNKATTGATRKVGDTFKVDFGQTWVEFKIVEAIPDKKIVWRVTDCHLHWLKDKTEWTDTKVVWDIEAASDTTTVTMTHVGLTPAVECYEGCEKGWDFYVGKSLLQLFTEDRGLADQK